MSMTEHGLRPQKKKLVGRTLSEIPDDQRLALACRLKKLVAKMTVSAAARELRLRHSAAARLLYGEKWKQPEMPAAVLPAPTKKGRPISSLPAAIEAFVNGLSIRDAAHAHGLAEHTLNEALRNRPRPPRHFHFH